jgi:mRNA-degrading endonuclease toxin of MazEF toxin-antitoxin module
VVDLAQFDIVKNPSKTSAKEIPFFVVLQYDFLLTLPRVVVAPLRLEAKELPEMLKLNPRLTFDGKKYVVLVDLISSLDRRMIREINGTAKSIQYEIKSAIDFLVSGF